MFQEHAEQESKKFTVMCLKVPQKNLEFGDFTLLFHRGLHM